MKPNGYVLIVVLCFLVFMQCGPKVKVPPLIDLKKYETLGVIEFTCSNKGKLGKLVTEKFVEWIRKDQGMIRVVELGTQEDVLNKIGSKQLDKEAYIAVGQQNELNTIITGVLTISDIRPDIAITPGLSILHFGAEVDASLAVQMVESSTGASIWSKSASATREVGHVSIIGGDLFIFDADDPERAYGKLVDVLVKSTSKDFRVTWERKKK